MRTDLMVSLSKPRFSAIDFIPGSPCCASIELSWRGQMPRIRYLLITAALLHVNWAIHAYRSAVLDPEFLVYGQSVSAVAPASGRDLSTSPTPGPPQSAGRLRMPKRVRYLKTRK